MKKVKLPWEFSKFIVIFESALIAYLTYHGIRLAYLCVAGGLNDVPAFVMTLVSLAWGSYGTGVAFYFNKAKAENQLKIQKAANQEAGGDTEEL